MADNKSVCALRFPDGSIKWYVDEEYAVERGVDPAQLVSIEIPKELLQKGTIQEIGEYVATYLESHESSIENKLPSS